MEVEIMIYWSNHYGYVDINDYPYMLDNIIYTYITYYKGKHLIGIYVIHGYHASIVKLYQIPSNAHIIMEVKHPNIEYYIREEFFNIPEYEEHILSKYYHKAYLVFPSKSEMLKWKLKS